jgi:hypothetical protein
MSKGISHGITQKRYHHYHLTRVVVASPTIDKLEIASVAYDGESR